jgi:hypothetical protein
MGSKQRDLWPYTVGCDKLAPTKLLVSGKISFDARKSYDNLYAPAIGVAICFSCTQLVHTRNIKTMESHWEFPCTGNKDCENVTRELKKVQGK